MGAYINPETEGKEAFLRREGEKVEGNLEWERIPKGFLPVILVDNLMFTAAGIAYSKKELEEFTNPNDTRRKEYYLVEKNKLYPVSNLESYLKEG